MNYRATCFNSKNSSVHIYMTQNHCKELLACITTPLKNWLPWQIGTSQWHHSFFFLPAQHHIQQHRCRFHTAGLWPYLTQCDKKHSPREGQTKLLATLEMVTLLKCNCRVLCRHPLPSVLSMSAFQFFAVELHQWISTALCQEGQSHAGQKKHSMPVQPQLAAADW